LYAARGHAARASRSDPPANHPPAP
jgi:hypothetical protein